jgi:hypothetical protein
MKRTIAELSRCVTRFRMSSEEGTLICLGEPGLPHRESDEEHLRW